MDWDSAKRHCTEKNWSWSLEIIKQAQIEMEFHQFQQEILTKMKHEKQVESEMSKTWNKELVEDPNYKRVWRNKMELLKVRTKDKNDKENIDDFEKHAKSDFNALIRGLSKLYEHSLLLIDEVPSVKIQDWSDLETLSNVEWMIGLSPGGYENSENGDSYKIVPPVDPKILSLQLKRMYRNSIYIRKTIKF